MLFDSQDMFYHWINQNKNLCLSNHVIEWIISSVIKKLVWFADGAHGSDGSADAGFYGDAHDCFDCGRRALFCAEDL